MKLKHIFLNNFLMIGLSILFSICAISPIWAQDRPTEYIMNRVFDSTNNGLKVKISGNADISNLTADNISAENITADRIFYEYQTNAPGTPEVGESVTYAKSDGNFYFKNAAGTETQLNVGSASPGGSSGNLQFNNAGSFGGAAGLVYNSAINGSSGTEKVLAITADVAQSVTAGYTGLEMDITETSTGSGIKSILNLKVGTVSKISADNAGALKPVVLQLPVTYSPNGTAVAATGIIRMGPDAANNYFLHCAGDGGIADGNTFLGRACGNFSVTGNNNTGIGHTTLAGLSSGANNTMIGSGIGSMATGSNNSGVGYQVLAQATSSNNTALGTQALGILTSGANNTGIGFNAGASNNTGNGCVYLGYLAGPPGSVIPESNKLYIGVNNTEATTLIYGDFSNQTVSLGSADDYSSKLHILVPNNGVGQIISFDAVQASVDASDIFVDFRSTTGSEGSIAGTAVPGVIAYNTFLGSHYTQITGNEPLEIGMVLEMTGNLMPETMPHLPISQICKTIASSKIYGIYGGTLSDNKSINVSKGDKNEILKNRIHTQMNQHKNEYNRIKNSREGNINENLKKYLKDHPLIKLKKDIPENDFKNFILIDPSLEEINEKKLSENLNGILLQEEKIHLCFGVGAGLVLVSNKNGNIETGDLLESDGQGYAQKQNDTIIKSSTIGKACQSVNWVNENENKKLIGCLIYSG